jgi:DNA recombination-dependent growth factor C
MGLLSSSLAITRYRVEGEVPAPLTESVREGLRKHSIQDIDTEAFEKAAGWTAWEQPFQPAFEGDSFTVGPYFLFSLRIDKKTIPPKIVKKEQTKEMARRLADTDRTHLSRNEKKEIREQIIQNLSLRIPATPHVYELLWHPTDGWLWFFSSQKAANEELETLFSKSFKASLIRLFPYTIADLNAGLSPEERDLLGGLSPTRFKE